MTTDELIYLLCEEAGDDVSAFSQDFVDDFTSNQDSETLDWLQAAADGDVSALFFLRQRLGLPIFS